MTRQIVFWGLAAVLVFLPLPIGSVEEWAVFVFEAATLFLFLLYLGGELAGRIKRGRANGVSILRPSTLKAGGFEPAEGGSGEAPDRPIPLLPAAIKFFLVVFLAVSLLQVVPLPAGIVKFLSPRAFDIYAGLVRDGLAAPAASLTLSLTPSVSLSDLVLVLCYGLFGFLVLRTVRSRRQAELLVLVVLASALFQAVYGMAETFSGHEMILGRAKRYGLGSVTGTFVNRNHLAGFLEMAFPLSLGYLLAKARYFAMEKGLTLRQRILWFSQESLQWTLLLGLVPVFIGVGIVFSKSRSGIMVFVLTALLAAVAAASWRDISEDASGAGEEGHEGRAAFGRAAKRRFGRLVRLVAAAVLAAAVWLGLGPVVERFAEMDITGEARRVFYENTLDLIRAFPWTGTGKGTYVDAYAMFEKVDDGLRLSFAHNDYLEFASENGLIAGAALVAAGLGFLVWLASLWRRSRSGFAKAIGLGAVLAVAALLVHGLTDFNLQITANAVYFVMVAMLGVVVLKKERGHVPSVHVPLTVPTAAPSAAASISVAAARVPVSRADSGDPWRALADHRRLGWFARLRRGPLVLLAAAFAALLLFVPAYRDFRGFHYLARYREARAAARSVESAFPRLEALLERAADASPRADFRIELGRLYMEMGRVSNDAGRDEDRETFCDRASSAYERAIAANPVRAFTYYEAGLVYLLSNYPLMTYADRAKAYFRKALELKPADEFLHVNILFLYFTWWDGLEEAEKAYAAGLYRSALSRDPRFTAKLEARWVQSFTTPDRLRAILAELPR